MDNSSDVAEQVENSALNDIKSYASESESDTENDSKTGWFVVSRMCIVHAWNVLNLTSTVQTVTKSRV